MHAAQVNRELEIPSLLVEMYDGLTASIEQCRDIVRSMQPDVDALRSAVAAGKESLAQQAPTLHSLCRALREEEQRLAQLESDVEKDEKLMRKGRAGSMTRRTTSEVTPPADALTGVAAVLQRRPSVTMGSAGGAASTPAEASGVHQPTPSSSTHDVFRPNGGWRSQAVRARANAALKQASNRVCADCATPLMTTYMLARSIGVVLCPDCARVHIELAGDPRVFFTGSHGATIVPVGAQTYCISSFSSCGITHHIHHINFAMQERNGVFPSFFFAC